MEWLCDWRMLIRDPDGDLHVFGYGSLIWRPGFAHAGAELGTLRGYHRSFCLRSTRYRGTVAKPGLVLGLDRGGACRGMVFHVEAIHAAEVLAYLDDRELPDGAEIVYRRREVDVRLAASGQVVKAVTYIANRACRNYCGRLASAEAAAVIAAGHGAMGSNRDYLLNTVEHLRAVGVRDRGLERIAGLMPRLPVVAPA
jgi:glutathione-specific gamma-glutamylcyclotransferase